MLSQIRFTFFALATLLLTQPTAQTHSRSSSIAQAKTLQKITYDNYSFDYSAHEVPIAYTSVDNTVELHSKVKLNPQVPMRGGGYILDNPLERQVFEEFEIEVEFTVNSDPATARGFALLFNRNSIKPKEFTSSMIGYRTDYEGIGVYVFRHISQVNKWYVMTVQNAGVQSVFKANSKIESALYSSNSCLIDITQGDRAGLRLQLVKGRIRMEIMDSADVAYRYCQEVEMKDPQWDKYYFALAAKNYRDSQKKNMITDIDINSIKFSIYDEELMPNPKQLENERYKLLLTRKNLINPETGKMVGDIEDLFSKGIAHEVKTQQRKNLVFIEEEDEKNEMLFKHYETLRGYRYNLEKFNEQLKAEVRSEDELYSHVVSSQSLLKNQRLLNSLFSNADTMLTEVNEICADTRSTIDKIIESEPIAPVIQEEDDAPIDLEYINLDRNITKSLEGLHTSVDRMQLDIQDSQKLIIDYRKAYEDVYGRIPIDSQDVQKESTANKFTQRKRVDPQIMDAMQESLDILVDTINEEIYGSDFTSLSMLLALAIAGGLAFTAMKVNKLISKSHSF